MENGRIEMKSYIWPLGNRISHILMILFFGTAYILGDMDHQLKNHVIFGLSFGVLVLFRIAWGFLGPHYSRFSDFNFKLKDLAHYLLNIFSSKEKYEGHNPASSYAIIAMLILAILAILSGMLAYGIEENHGIFAFLHSARFKEMEFFEEAHELFANLFLMVVIAHVAGSLIDKFIKKNDAIDSMISGYKSTLNPIKIETTLVQKIFQVLWVILSLYGLYFLLTIKDNLFIASYNQPVSYASLNANFDNECGSCHITYPPYLLPKESWVKMMNELDDHFGDDASLDEQTRVAILDFLEKNSAETSTHKAAFKITKSLKNSDETIIAVSSTPYWKAKHKDIDSKVFDTQAVKNKANCIACHKEIDTGLLEKDLIALPKGLHA